ncbi:hypothetical protein ACI2LF_05695 [Kribbella sp. NPDC020789]
MSDYPLGELRRDSVELAKRLRLRDVRLLDLRCTATNPLLDGPFRIGSKLDVRTDVEAERLGVEVRYRIGAVSESEEDQPEVWSVSLRVLAEYVDQGEDEEKRLDEFSAEECRAFGLMIGLVTVHPYARELVQSMSGRMGYPPYTAEMLESVAVAPDEAVLRIT